MGASLIQSGTSPFNYFGTAPLASFKGPTIAGDLLVMVIQGDTNTPTWTVPTGWVLTAGSGSGGVWIYYYENNPGGIIAVSPTASVSTYAQVTLLEYAGFTTGTFDTGARTVGNAASSSLTITGGADTNANDLVVAAFAVNSASGGQTVTPEAGWSFVENNYANNIGTVLVQWTTVSATGAQTATGASTGSNGYNAAIATFKIAVNPIYYEMYHDQDENDNTTYSTLNGAISSTTATTLVVHDATKYSGIPYFHIKIDKEILYVTGISGNTLTVSRGQEGTTAATHLDAAPVYQVLTATALLALMAKAQVYDRYLNLPSAQYAGRVFRDNRFPLMWRDNGASWDAFGPSHSFSAVPVVIGGSWTWVNQGLTFVDESYGKPYFEIPSGGGSDNIHMLVRTLPAAPYSLTVAFLPNLIKATNSSFGIGLYDTISGKIVSYAFKFDANSVPQFTSDKWNSTTSWSASYTTHNFYMTGVIWMRIMDDGVNRTLWYSSDGAHYIQVYSVGNTDFMTPNRIGLFMSQNGSESPCGLTLLSWSGIS